MRKNGRETSKSVKFKSSEKRLGQDWSHFIVQAEMALNNNDPASEIVNAQLIDNQISLFYLGDSYYRLGNFANAIKSVQLFNKFIGESMSRPDVRKANLPYQLMSNSLFLTYLYVMEKEYKDAVFSFEGVLEYFSLNGLFEIFGELVLENGRTEFDAHIINYSIALDQLNKISPAIKIVEEALAFDPNNNALQKRDHYLKKRLSKMSEKETPASYLRIKRSYDIEVFEKTQMLSREKTLEDMIEERIKYGYKVFGRDLKMYDSDTIRGRQYIIRNKAGILDLLLFEKSTDTLYVVELKRNKAGAAVYEQVKRYMEGISLETDKKVKGIICLHNPSDELMKLVKKDNDVELYEYHFEFKKLG